MCGLMPSDDAGYDLALYPNLARYRTPQRGINDTTAAAYTAAYTATHTASDNNTYHYTAYSPSLQIPEYKPNNNQPQKEEEDGEAQQQQQKQQQQDEDDDDEEEEFPMRHPTTTATTPINTTKAPKTLPTSFVRLFASDILLWGDQWRRCPACLGGKVCLVRGRCVEDGRRVKVLFW
jgi:hypothetical protein